MSSSDSGFGFTGRSLNSSLFPFHSNPLRQGNIPLLYVKMQVRIQIGTPLGAPSVSFPHSSFLPAPNSCPANHFQFYFKSLLTTTVFRGNILCDSQSPLKPLHSAGQLLHPPCFRELLTFPSP